MKQNAVTSHISVSGVEKRGISIYRKLNFKDFYERVSSLKIITTLILLFFCTKVNGQGFTKISGTITDTSGIVLQGVLIYTDNLLSSTTNTNGFFELSLPQSDTIMLHIQLLGYEKRDTLCNITSNTFFQFMLYPNTYTLPEVSILASKENLFDKEDWTILSCKVYDSNLIILARQGQFSYLHLCSIDGSFLNTHQLKERYHTIHESCLGGIHLIGNKICAEVSISDEINILNTYTRERFTNLFEPCIAKYEDNLLFKSLKKHNKRLDYFYYKNKSSQVFYSIWDKVSERIAQNYYNDILRSYHIAINQVDKSAIDLGFEQTNIVREGLWDGDLVKLAITNELVVDISYYNNIVSSPINSAEIVIKDKLFLFDFLNSTLLTFSNGDLKKPTTSKLKSSVWKINNLKIIRDVISSRVYLIDDRKNIYMVDTRNQFVEIQMIDNLNKNKFLIENEFIRNGVVYFIGRSNPINTNNKLYRVKL